MKEFYQILRILFNSKIIFSLLKPESYQYFFPLEFLNHVSCLFANLRVFFLISSIDLSKDKSLSKYLNSSLYPTVLSVPKSL